MRKFQDSCMLVCFIKRREDFTIQDQVYHVFTDCLTHTEFVHDEYFKRMTALGYTWGACPFSLDLAYQCDFDISTCCDYSTPMYDLSGRPSGMLDADMDLDPVAVAQAPFTEDPFN